MVVIPRDERVGISLHTTMDRVFETEVVTTNADVLLKLRIRSTRLQIVRSPIRAKPDRNKVLHL